MTGTGRDGEQGFTLVEVLVAFAIVSVGMVMALQVAGSTTAGIGRLARANVVADEAEGIVMLRVAAGLRPDLEEGAFSDGAPWTLRVSDVGPRAGWRGVAPLWRISLTRGGPSGRPVYTTLVAGDYGG